VLFGLWVEHNSFWGRIPGQQEVTPKEKEGKSVHTLLSAISNVFLLFSHVSRGQSRSNARCRPPPSAATRATLAASVPARFLLSTVRP